MTDLFGAAAAREQQKRAKESQNSEITMQNNALVRLMNERAEIRRQEEAKRAAWNKEVETAFCRVADACRSCGRDVSDIKYNGEVVFVRRKSEAIRLFVGKIKDQRDLQYAASSLMRAIMGC